MKDDAQLIDITREIHPDMAIYPNNASVEFELLQEAIDGKNALSKVTLGTHTGTHIDTPHHIHADGAGALTYALEQMNGSCEVVDVSHLESVITAADVPATTQPRIIFKTRNSQGNPNVFDDDFVALDDSAAAECVKRGLKLVGLDALSIRKRGTKNQVHETLIDNGVVIVEGLWLADVDAAGYELLCLPIKWDLDGAPARCVLRERS
jgi:arylformamidase